MSDQLTWYLGIDLVLSGAVSTNLNELLYFKVDITIMDVLIGPVTKGFLPRSPF